MAKKPAATDAAATTEAVGPTPSAEAQQSPTLAPPNPADLAAGAPPKRSNKRLVLAITLPIAGLIIVGGALGGGYAWGVAQHSPESAVSAFLDDLEQGRAEAAVARLDPAPTSDLTLATDAVYGGLEGHLTEHRITEVTVIGDQADVTVTLANAETNWSNTFKLHRTGQDGLFDVWSLDGGDLTSVTVTSPFPEVFKPTVNGIELPLEAGASSVTFLALPAVYQVELSGDASFGGDEPLATVEAREVAVESPVRSGVDVDPSLEPTEAGQEQAKAAVKSWIKKCLRSGSNKLKLSEACGGYYLKATAGHSYTNKRWSLKKMPEYELGAWNGTGWPVTTTKAGHIRWDADVTSATQYGTSWASFRDFEVRGVLTLGADGKFVYTSEWE